MPPFIIACQTKQRGWSQIDTFPTEPFFCAVFRSISQKVLVWLVWQTLSKLRLPL